MVKNLPAMQDTWVRSLGWEDYLEEAMATEAVMPAMSVCGDGAFEDERAQSFLTLLDPLDYSPPGKNAGVGCHLLLQGIFPT